MVNMLSYDTEMMEVLTKKSESVNQEDIFKAATVLNSLKISNKETIDSVFIINRVQKRVYGTMGTYDMEDFFNNVYRYSAYSYDYWMQYQAPYTERRIFAPAVIEKFSGSENVVLI